MKGKRSMKLKTPPEPKRRQVTVDTPVSDGGPDWQRGHSIHGGGERLAEIPRPWIFRFPNDAGVRRDVNVEISTWRGNSIDASHYYARVELERNSIWDPINIGWRESDQIPQCKDVFFRAHVESKADAILFIEAVVKAFYSDEKLYRLQHRQGLYTEVSTWEEIKRFLAKDD